MRRGSGAPTVDQDPRKPLAPLSRATEAAPFDRAAVEALLATTAAWPGAKMGRGAAIAVVHQPLAFSGSFARRRPVPLHEAGKWMANIALAGFAIAVGLSAVNGWRAEQSSPPVTTTPQTATNEAPSLFTIRPQPLVEEDEPADQATAEMRPAPRSTTTFPDPEQPQPSRAYAEREAAPSPPLLASPPVVETYAPVLAMAPPPKAGPVVLVRRQASAAVLGESTAPHRAGDDGDGAGLRSVEPERMALAVDIRQATRP
jgi:hypothetical protein